MIDARTNALINTVSQSFGSAESFRSSESSMPQKPEPETQPQRLETSNPLQYMELAERDPK